MTTISDYIEIDHNTERLAHDPSLKDHVAHVICLQGEMKILFNGNRFVLQEGDIMALPIQAFLEEQETSDDFQCICVYVSPEMIEAPFTPPPHVSTRCNVDLQEAYHASRSRKDESDYGRCGRD